MGRKNAGIIVKVKKEFVNTSRLASMSYYNLGSPIFWLILFFPSTAYPYLVGWLFILVYGLSGLFSYSYIQYFVKEKKYALLGSILYSFSGFQSVNIIFFFFHTIISNCESNSN